MTIDKSYLEALRRLDTWRVFGNGVSGVIGAVEGRLDCTSLAPGGSGPGYPMVVEIWCEGESVELRQGGSTVVCGTVNARLPADTAGVERVMVDANSAYVAYKRTGTGTGTLYAVRVDDLP